MPRRARTWRPSGGAHFISRFVDWRFHLISDSDRRWLSYALMSSHVHYGLIPGVVAPERFFRSLHTRFAQSYHRRTAERTLGPVFADRPQLYDVPKERLARMVAYHHRNPVEAGVVRLPKESTWTSHRAYLRMDAAPRWLDVEWALSVLGFADTAAGRRQFDEFVIETDLWDPATERVSSARRESREHIHGGTAAFQLADDKWVELIEHAQMAAGMSPAQSVGASPRCKAAMARRIIAVIATEDLNQSYQRVGSRLGIRPGSVFNLVDRARRFRAEDRRRLNQLVNIVRARFGTSKHD